MSLEKVIFEAIIFEAQKLIERYHAYHNALHLEHERNKKRIYNPPPKEVRRPPYWSINKRFNPFYVRKRASSIAHSIALKIENKTYKPRPPYIMAVDKADGAQRQVSIYEIPDAAVSNVFYKQLLSKNKHRFSSFSYAYRNDKNVHYAIQDIAVDLSQDARTFVAEFDFSDFFGSISHEYLKEQFEENGFFISDAEKYMIEAFLDEREVGIPQGTSISLFLANLACWKLDKNLEREGLKFARYADDTVIWSPDYSKICKAFSLMESFSREAGVLINSKKSDGISLLSRDGLPTEISAKSSIDFLGYSIAVDKVSIRKKSIINIKKQISYLLYRNLIQPLKASQLRAITIPANNKDEGLLTAIMQVRRYMYGALSNRQLINYINGRSKRIYFKGIMSFYPLLTDTEQLKQLDGWLVSTIYRSLQLRCKLLLEHGHDCRTIFPFNTSRNSLLEKCKSRKIYGKTLLEIPSFKLIQKALNKGLYEKGIDQVMNPLSDKYDY